ncbi:MAG: sulfurtransferase [Pseudomonadota bacterium]
MKTDMIPRNFGAFSSGATSLACPIAYANPQLLMEPRQLLKAILGKNSAAVGDTDSKTLVIDVRSKGAFEEGHIPGAQNLDPNAVVAEHNPGSGVLRSVAVLENLLGTLGVTQDRRIVFCDNRGGFNAARMLWLMEYLGHQNVAILNGGLAGWRAAGGTICIDATMPLSGSFEATPSSQRYASAQDVLKHRDAPESIVIDVRTHRKYDEGHIPWAINIPWSRNLDVDNRFLEAEFLMAHFENHGVIPEHDVILHCEVGLASSHTYVALRLLGFQRVRVYHRSWAEWGSDPTLPRVKA